MNLKAYCENEEDSLVFNNPNTTTPVKEQMEHMIENLKNPFDDMYHWCKGEVYDLQSLTEAVNSRDNIEKNLKKLEIKKKEV